MSKVSKVPQIRFKDFTDAWEQRKVADMFKITRGYVLAAPLTSEQKSDEMPYPVYSSQTKDQGLMGYYKDYLYEDAITWTTDGANAGTVNYRAGKFYCTNVCGVLLADKVVPNQMIAEALNNVAKGHVSYVGNPKLMNNVMAGIEISLPSSAEERDRIAEFFSEVDDLITLHQRKYDQVVNFKKAMLEKMFPKDGSDIPEIRFKEFSGQKSDSWEAAKMSEIASVIDPHPSHRAPDVVYSGIPFIGIGDVDETGEIDCSSARTVHERIFEEHKKRYDLSIPSIGIGRVASLGKVIRLRNDIGKYAVSPTMAIIQFSRNVDNNYMYSFMCTASFQKQFSSQGNGSTRQSVGIQDLRELMVLLPKKNREQETIGKYFNCLDNLCILYQRKLQQLKKIKKAMLEKMFV